MPLSQINIKLKLMFKIFIGTTVFIFGSVLGFFVSHSLNTSDLQTNITIQPLQLTATASNIAPSNKGGSCN